MGVDVSGPHLVQNEVGIGSLGPRPKVHHQRFVAQLARRHPALHTVPRGVICIPRAASPVVGHLDAYDQVRVGQGDAGGRVRLHPTHVLLAFAHHAQIDHVQKSKHAGLRLIDNGLLEVFKAFPARSARIHKGCCAICERVDVR